MLGDRIKKIRIEKGLTQKELADKLYVTAQAVSRWENNEVEPSVSTLTEMAGVFGMTVGQIIDEEDKPAERVVEKVVEKEYVYKEQKPVLAVCKQCNKPIYEGSDMVRKLQHFDRGIIDYIICKSCDEKIKEIQHKKATAFGIEQRRKSFVRGGIFTALITAFLLLCAEGANEMITMGIVGLLFFPFLSCMYLKNTFVVDMFDSISTFGIRFPRIIFPLDLDGIIWLIGVKLLFWAIGAILSVFCFIAAVIAGLAVSVFVYPHAIRKSFKNPELSEDI